MRHSCNERRGKNAAEEQKNTARHAVPANGGVVEHLDDGADWTLLDDLEHPVAAVLVVARTQRHGHGRGGRDKQKVRLRAFDDGDAALVQAHNGAHARGGVVLAARAVETKQKGKKTGRGRVRTSSLEKYSISLLALRMQKRGVATRFLASTISKMPTLSGRAALGLASSMMRLTPSCPPRQLVKKCTKTVRPWWVASLLRRG